MNSLDGFTLFARALERFGLGEQLTFPELVELARRSAIPLAQAGNTLDLMIARGQWHRIYLDEDGRVVDPEMVATRRSVWGPAAGRRVQVAWRRGRQPRRYLLA